MQSQTKHELFKVLDKNHRKLLKKNMKAALDNSHFFFTRVKFLGHIIEGNTITPLKFRIETILKLPLKKKKFQEFFGMLNFLSNYVYKMQLYLRPYFNIRRQQNNFEWTTEHPKDLKKQKHSSLNKYQIIFQIQTNHFMLCATPPISASAQHYYNHTVEKTK